MNSSNCGICGEAMVEIRGRWPKDERRKVCAQCTTERLEQIREIADSHYGVAMQEPSTLAPEKIG